MWSEAEDPLTVNSNITSRAISSSGAGQNTISVLRPGDPEASNSNSPPYPSQPLSSTITTKTSRTTTVDWLKPMATTGNAGNASDQEECFEENGPDREAMTSHLIGGMKGLKVGSVDSETENDVSFLADSFLSQCHTSSSETSTSDNENEVENAGEGDNVYTEDNNVDNETQIFATAADSDSASDSNSTRDKKISFDATATSSGSLFGRSRDSGAGGIMGSPQHRDFLKRLGIGDRENNSGSLFFNSRNGSQTTNPKPRFEYTEQAHDAHIRLRRLPMHLMDLNQNTADSNKKKQISEKANESSFFGMFFKKMVSWEQEVEEKEEGAARDTNTEVLNPSRTPISRSPSAQELQTESILAPQTTELGLQPRCVARVENFNRQLRKRAQEGLLEGKRNIAFLDKVEYVEIPNRRSVPKQYREKMFYTKSQFVGMIAKNMKEIEVEVRRKKKQKKPVSAK